MEVSLHLILLPSSFYAINDEFLPLDDVYELGALDRWSAKVISYRLTVRGVSVWRRSRPPQAMDWVFLRLNGLFSSSFYGAMAWFKMQGFFGIDNGSWQSSFYVHFLHVLEFFLCRCSFACGAALLMAGDNGEERRCGRRQRVRWKGKKNKVRWRWWGTWGCWGATCGTIVSPFLRKVVYARVNMRQRRKIWGMKSYFLKN